MLKIAHLQGGNFIFRLFVFQNSLFVQEPEGEPFFRKQKRDIAVCGEQASGDRPGIAQAEHIPVRGGESAVNDRVALRPCFQDQLVKPVFKFHGLKKRFHELFRLKPAWNSK